MRVLVVGSGGREHALAWALNRSALVEDLHTAPGNAGTVNISETHAVDAEDVEGQVALAKRLKPHLVVVGPEAPLAAGLADSLHQEGLTVFGPSESGARLESSKSYAKSLMESQGIPTARAEVFDDAGAAHSYVDEAGAPLVVKADGLAAGKGVVVCETVEEAHEAVRAAMVQARFGISGRRVLIEEKMVGEELSVLALFDGRTLLPMEPAQDFKRAFDEDQGPNTGGMGSYSPVPPTVAARDVLDRVADEILEPIAEGLRKDRAEYAGVIYAGLMITTDGPRVVEFNCRFGDPELQALIPRLDSDLAEALVACPDRSLDSVKLRWRPEACVCVVMASGGYPSSYETGFAVSGLEEAERITGVPVFHAGTALTEDSEVVTSGGRVVAVSALGDTIKEARERCYRAVSAVSFSGRHYRNDIAAKAEEG